MAAPAAQNSVKAPVTTPVKAADDSRFAANRETEPERSRPSTGISTTSSQSSQSAMQTATNPMMSDNMPSLNPEGTPNATTTGNDYEAAAKDALARGDYKAFDAIMKLADSFGPSSSAAVKPLSAEAAKVVSNAQTGIQALQDFNSLIDTDPGAFSRTNIPGVGVIDKLTAGRASGALGTSGLNAARQQVIDVIARLRTGAAISADEAARFEQFVPQPGDPPEVRQQKTGYLLNQFQMVAQRSGTAGTDLQQMAGAQ